MLHSGDSGHIWNMCTDDRGPIAMSIVSSVMFSPWLGRIDMGSSLPIMVRLIDLASSGAMDVRKIQVHDHLSNFVREGLSDEREVHIEVFCHVVAGQIALMLQPGI